MLKRSKKRNFDDVIGKLSVGAGEYISACDYDIEGSLIAYTILRYICGEKSIKRARRMRFSTLTKRDLQSAFEERTPTLDFPMTYAVKARLRGRLPLRHILSEGFAEGKALRQRQRLDLPYLQEWNSPQQGQEDHRGDERGGDQAAR